MKRILHILPSLELGGTEAFIMNHYRVIDRSEYQFDFLIFAEKKWPYLQEIEALGGRVFYACPPSLLHIRKFYRCFRKAIIMGGPYAAIHCHADAGNAVPLLCGRVCGIGNRISHTHSMGHIPKDSFAGLIYRFRKTIIRFAATRYLACSNDAGRALYGEDFFDKYGAVLKNGICVEKYCKVNYDRVEILKHEFGITSSNNLIFGIISRFDKNKNQLFAIKVFEHILAKYQNAVLLLGGTDGGELRNIQQYVVKHGLEKNVRFIGKRHDVEVCLKLIDVYLLPSISEGLGIGLLEAQAAGCLCFASSGVPKESDVSLGNVSYLHLADGEKYWAEAIFQGLEKRMIPTEREITQKFEQKSFDVRKSTEELVMHYE